VPAHGGGRERALAIFTRSVPPRLARVSDRTSDVAVYRLAGPGALAVAVAAGLEVPPTAGHVLPRPDGGETARATEGAPFVLQVTVPAAAAALLAARLEAAGAVAAGPATLELSRILAGWPRLAGAGRWIGLALIRRDVEPGSVVRAAGRDARVVDLPFAFPIAAPA